MGLKVNPPSKVVQSIASPEKVGATGHVQDLNSMLNVHDHDRIIKDIGSVCKRAGIPEKYLRHSATKYCRPAEIKWLAEFYETGHPGLVITGDRGLERCMSLAGALLRNYVDARVLTIESALEGFTPPQATCMFIPNFYTTASGKTTPGWKLNKLYDLMLSRFQGDQPTVVWVEHLAGVKEYGTAMYDLLSAFQKA
jgi:hypothetical protein